MRPIVAFLLITALIWGGMPLVQPLFDAKGGAAFAKSGSSDDDSDDDDDDDDDDNSGSSGSGSSGSGSSGSGSSGSGSSGSSGSGSAGSGSSGSSSSSSSSSASGSGSSSSGTGSGRSAPGGGTLFGGDGIHIQFKDGHVERIRGGRFEKLDGRGRVVESHAARRSDLNRLRSLGAATKRKGTQKEVQNVVRVNEAQGAVEVTDFRGWSETVARGTYVLKDPNGRTVVRRGATKDDILRIRSMLAVD